MKRPISVRKTALMVATVLNTSARDNGFMSCLASCESPGSQWFRSENVSVPNAAAARCERRRPPRRPFAAFRPHGQGGSPDRSNSHAPSQWRLTPARRIMDSNIWERALSMGDRDERSASYGLRDHGILQVICPTCQTVFAGSRLPTDRQATLHGVVFDILGPSAA
jgi:hypothetical protein